MVRVLVLDNSELVNRNGVACTNAMNGAFVTDLKNAGADVTYCHFLVKKDTSISQYPLDENGIKVLPLPFKKGKLLRYISAYCIFLRKLRRFDFVYLYYPSSFKHITLICKILGVQFGLYVRGQQKLDDRVSHWIYRNAYTIRTVSDFFTNKINGIAHREVASTIRPMIPQTYDDIVNDRNYHLKRSYSVLYFGRIEVDKGLRELLKAVSNLRNYSIPFTLNIVGNGSFASELDKMAEELGLTEMVRIKGPIYDLHEKKSLFLDADIYIIPTYHEGFPRTLYESMIYGTPIITTMVGGIPALMKDKENCIGIQPKSVESIQNALQYAFENYDEMGKLANNATELIKKIIAKDRLSHGYGLYNSICKLC